MKKLHHLDEFPKLSKANSFVVDGHIIYVKKDISNTIYNAWLYPSGMLITVGITKDKVKQLIESRIHLLHALNL